MQGLSIGKLARSANVSIDTIRFYEKSGLLPQPARLPSGFRQYSQGDLRQLKFIRRGRELGFSLQDIGELLALSGGNDAAAVGASIKKQVVAIDRKLEQLQRWRGCLLALVTHSAGSPRNPHSIVDIFADDVADTDTAADPSSKKHR